MPKSVKLPKPVSAKQLAANQANAKKSTGPVTPEGKARSARNSVKHGFASTSFTVLRLEDPDEIARLKADAVAVYQPANSQELAAVERIALAQQIIFRAYRLEAGLFTSCLNEALDRDGDLYIPLSRDMAVDIDVSRAQNRNYALAEGFDKMARHSPSLALMLRYQANAERQYRRAVEEFERLKVLRPDLPIQDLPIEPILETEPAQTEPVAGPPRTQIPIRWSSRNCPFPSFPRTTPSRALRHSPPSPIHRSPSPRNWHVEPPFPRRFRRSSPSPHPDYAPGAFAILL